MTPASDLVTLGVAVLVVEGAMLLKVDNCVFLMKLGVEFEAEGNTAMKSKFGVMMIESWREQVRDGVIDISARYARLD